MKIIQIIESSKQYQRSGKVYHHHVGLGEDNKLYWYNAEIEEWVPIKHKKEEINID